MGFVRITSLPAVREHLTPELYVDNALHDRTLIKVVEIIDFKNHFWSNMWQWTLNSDPTDNYHIATEKYFDFLSEIDRSRHDLTVVFHNNDI